MEAEQVSTGSDRVKERQSSTGDRVIEEESRKAQQLLEAEQVCICSDRETKLSKR